jgi:cholinesterase
MNRIRCNALLATLLLACAVSLLPLRTLAAQGAPFSRMYVFGDSYSDIGEGYLDGDGPTSVAYLAQRLGFPLMRANDPAAQGKSLDFAISAAKTGSGTGKKIGDALLGLGMRNQVDDFAARVRAHTIEFDPQTTLFFFAGGLNDKDLPTAETVKNLEDEIRTVYALGGRRFMVALLPTAIPDFSAVSIRLNPALARIPDDLKAQLPEAHVNLSHWGAFYDGIMNQPIVFGIVDTKNACAGRAIFHQNATPCATPSAYYYYHQGHPSTAVHKIVGDMLYNEVMTLVAKGLL